MKPNPLPDQAALLSLLRYDPDTGKLYWRERQASDFPNTGNGGSTAHANRWKVQRAGKEAFCTVTHDGRYLKGTINGRTLIAHRVIFKMLHGYDPDEIDHDNGNGLDNRPENLFDRTSQQNNRNRRIPRTNKSGVMGVFWCNNSRKWKAAARGDNGKIVHLGYFTDFEEAVRAREHAVVRLGYHPNHGRAA